MKIKTLVLVLLMLGLLTGTAVGAWSPQDFDYGAPSGIAPDGETLLVSDVYNKVIWRITRDGVEQAVGKIDIPGLTGEPVGAYADGALAEALFTEPWAVTPFLEGFVVSDSRANVIRYFDENHVRTAAGSGKAGMQNGLGTLASFSRPTGLATGEDGRVYIADTDNGAIRILSKTGQVSTLLSGLTEPTGLCWHEGSLYVAETGRSRILKITDGALTVIAGGEEADADGVYPGGYVNGPVARARFDHPQGIVLGADGVIYVADTGNNAIRIIENDRVDTLLASSAAPEGCVRPRGLTLWGEDALLAADLFAQTLLEVALSPVRYEDVAEDAWYAQPVYTALRRGIAQGTGEGSFSPDAPLTRATLAVMLSRVHSYADGSSVIDGESVFEDVPADTWYTQAVAWAADQGITQGMAEGLFAPDAPITREQLAAFLYRYARYMGCDTAAVSSELTGFEDADTVSDYALEALRWACGAGIITGVAEGRLAPQSQATRAEAVKMLVSAMDALGY